VRLPSHFAPHSALSIRTLYGADNVVDAIARQLVGAALGAGWAMTLEGRQLKDSRDREGG
jgi:hypothetical protein